MRVRQEQRPRAAVVAARGRLRGSDVADLRRSLLVAAADEPDVLVCDLREAYGDATVLDELQSVGEVVARWPGCPLRVTVSPALGSALWGRRGRSQWKVDADLDDLSVPRRAAPGEPEGPMDRVRLTLTPTLHAPGVARRFLTAVLQAWGRLDDIAVGALVVTELVTNAVVHAGTPIVVSAYRSGERVAIAVADTGDGEVARRPSPPPPDVGTPPSADALGPDGTERGRGLILVEGLTHDWGVLPRDPVGKVVWAVVA